MKIRLMGTSALALLAFAASSAKADMFSYDFIQNPNIYIQGISANGAVSVYDYDSGLQETVFNGTYSAAVSPQIPYPVGDSTDSYNYVIATNSLGNSVGSFDAPACTSDCGKISNAFTYIDGVFSPSVPPIPNNYNLDPNNEYHTYNPQLMAINDSNVAVGYLAYGGYLVGDSYTGYSGQCAYEETGGSYSSCLGVDLDKNNDSELLGINNSREVYGYSSSSTGYGQSPQYFTYQDGTYTDISYPGAASTVVTSIDDDGTVWGYASTAMNGDPSGTFTIFSDKGGVYTGNGLNVPGSDGTYINGVNTSGYATGLVVLGDGSAQSFEAAPVPGPLVLGAATPGASSSPGPASTDVPEPTATVGMFSLAFLTMVAGLFWSGRSRSQA